MNSNVLPLKARKRPIWYLFENSESRSEFSGFSNDVQHSAQIVKVTSPEMFGQVNLFFTPELIFIKSNLDWTDSIKLIETLNKRYHSPLLMFFDPDQHRCEEEIVKKAYQAGVLEVINTKTKDQEISESISFALKVSKSALS